MNNLKQKNWKGDVIAQHYCMVKIPRAELGYTTFRSGIKGRDKCKRR